MGDKIDDKVAAEILAKCGRCCCICRRFRPTLLQVHHIVEQSAGGSDDPDNLIAACLTCHSDVHTHRPFTRRFKPEELKRHRDAVYTLVAEGKLVPPEDDAVPGNYEGVMWEETAEESGVPELPPEAVDILIATSEAPDGRVCMLGGGAGFTILAGAWKVSKKGPRIEACYRHAIDILQEAELLDATGAVMFRITHEGYLLADKLLALRARSTEGQ